jgi:hypothetical protein
MLSARRTSRCLLIAGLAGALMVGCGGLKEVPLLTGDPEVLPEGVIQEHTCMDFWAFVHFVSGYWLGNRLGEDSFTETLLILTGYEIAEPQFWPRWGENRLNQQCDIAVGQLGWLAWYVIDDE